MKAELVNISRTFLQSSLGLHSGETLLVITDNNKMELAENVFRAGEDLGAESMLMVMMPREKSGQEPPAAIAAAMAAAQVVVCITSYSLTHTAARKTAAAAGARIATMPGITEDMFYGGAIAADYEQIKKRTEKFTKLLTEAKEVAIEKAGYCLTFSLTERSGVASTGVYRNPGESGNLPSGEAYIAPLEGTAAGQILVDASMSGIGRLKEPVLLTVKQGRLIAADGENGQVLLDNLGDGNGRNLAEFGIGTNDQARIIGIALEDEKVYGTIHVAFGSNDTFGGKVAAGVHIDCIVRNPDVWLDGQQIIKQGNSLMTD